VAALRELATAEGGEVPIGAYLTSPRAAFGAQGIVESCDAVWVEVRAMQAAVFGIPARQMLTAEPLDDYLQRKLLGVDPRVTLDESTRYLLGRIASVQSASTDTPIGMRLTGPVPQQGATQLYELGFRRFAVDLDQTRPLVLALGKAALGAG
jgi:pyruvate,orthophosphate dikinase